MDKYQKTGKMSLSDISYLQRLGDYLRDEAPATLSAAGNHDILELKKLAFFCSVKCPGHFILKTHDLIKAFHELPSPRQMAVIGGFHSPVEKECLRILLRGSIPIIICPARSLTGMKLPKELIEPLAEGRILFLSPFKETERRNSEKRAVERNRFVAALADQVLVAYAAPKSKTEQFCQEVLGWGKPLFTLEGDANANLLAIGVKPVSPDNVARRLFPGLLACP